jgi:hypothetical protein
MNNTPSEYFSEESIDEDRYGNIEPLLPLGVDASISSQCLSTANRFNSSNFSLFFGK